MKNNLFKTLLFLALAVLSLACKKVKSQMSLILRQKGQRAAGDGNSKQAPDKIFQGSWILFSKNSFGRCSSTLAQR